MSYVTEITILLERFLNAPQMSDFSVERRGLKAECEDKCWCGS